jgi:hypothetical protein
MQEGLRHVGCRNKSGMTTCPNENRHPGPVPGSNPRRAPTHRRKLRHFRSSQPRRPTLQKRDARPRPSKIGFPLVYPGRCRTHRPPPHTPRVAIATRHRRASAALPSRARRAGVASPARRCRVSGASRSQNRQNPLQALHFLHFAPRPCDQRDDSDRPSSPACALDHIMRPPTQVCSTLIARNWLALASVGSVSTMMKSAHIPGASVP